MIRSHIPRNHQLAKVQAVVWNCRVNRYEAVHHVYPKVPRSFKTLIFMREMALSHLRIEMSTCELSTAMVPLSHFRFNVIILYPVPFRRRKRVRVFLTSRAFHTHELAWRNEAAKYFGVRYQMACETFDQRRVLSYRRLGITNANGMWRGR